MSECPDQSLSRDDLVAGQNLASRQWKDTGNEVYVRRRAWLQRRTQGWCA